MELIDRDDEMQIIQNGEACDDCGLDFDFGGVCKDCERELCQDCYGARQFNDGSSVCVACDGTVELEDE